MKGRNLERVVKIQDVTVKMLDTSLKETHVYYQGQMADLTKQLENQKENTAFMERTALSYRDERDYYVGRERKQRRKNKVLTVIVVGLTGALLVK